MGKNKHRLKIKSNSALAIAAGCAVAFMCITTVISVALYRQHLNEVTSLLEDRDYQKYDSYVVFISGDDNQDYWKQVYSSAKEYGEENGIYVDMISQSLNVSYSKDELLEMAIKSGCDGILFEGDGSALTEELLREAESKDIAIITMGTDVTSPARKSFVSVSNYSMAGLYARELSVALKEKIDPDTGREIPNSVLVLEGPGSDEGIVGVLVTGIQEATGEISSMPQINFTRTAIEDKNAFSTEEFVQNLFQEDELPDAIICLDELTTTCVYQAIIDFNKVGQISLLGYYQSDVILQGIKQGVINATVTTDTRHMGEVAIQAFEEYDNTGYVSDYLTVENELISLSNVDAYMEENADE